MDENHPSVGVLRSYFLVYRVEKIRQMGLKDELTALHATYGARRESVAKVLAIRNDIVTTQPKKDLVCYNGLIVVTNALEMQALASLKLEEDWDGEIFISRDCAASERELITQIATKHGIPIQQQLRLNIKLGNTNVTTLNLRDYMEVKEMLDKSLMTIDDGVIHFANCDRAYEEAMVEHSPAIQQLVLSAHVYTCRLLLLNQLFITHIRYMFLVRQLKAQFPTWNVSISISPNLDDMVRQEIEAMTLQYEIPLI